jgi:predicted N-acyltransferase
MAAAAAAGDGQQAEAAAPSTMEPETQFFLTIKTHTKIDKIPRAAWNGLLRADDSPFLKHEWLWCLEESECAVPQTGWNPCHLTIRMQKGKDGQVVGATDGEGEAEDGGEIVAAAPWCVGGAE